MRGAALARAARYDGASESVPEPLVAAASLVGPPGVLAMILPVRFLQGSLEGSVSDASA
jgi:hypothetical protein